MNTHDRIKAEGSFTKMLAFSKQGIFIFVPISLPNDASSSLAKAITNPYIVW